VVRRCQSNRVDGKGAGKAGSRLSQMWYVFSGAKPLKATDA
jgi:hypothetical protein